MAKEKNKYFVVWKGFQPGIYTSWPECQKQVSGFPDAKYMGFKNYETARKAFHDGDENYWGKRKFESSLTEKELLRFGKPISDSIVVDAACSSKTGEVEYKGIHLGTGKVLFHKGPFADGTNNIGEFLALVHALAYLKKHNLSLPVYSDSRYAISWIQNKKARTNHPRSSKNKELFDLLKRAERWLKKNSYPNKILKWETRAWGENPADFGRK
jgi:ribonuclease HI